MSSTYQSVDQLIPIQYSLIFINSEWMQLHRAGTASQFELTPKHVRLVGFNHESCNQTPITRAARIQIMVEM